MNRDAAADAWWRFDHGVGPAPRVSRPLAVLDQVYVCDGCGAVLRYGQFCSSCKPRLVTS